MVNFEFVWRRGLLVDHSPGIEAAFRGRESPSRRRLDSRLGGNRALFGNYWLTACPASHRIPWTISFHRWGHPDRQTGSAGRWDELIHDLIHFWCPASAPALETDELREANGSDSTVNRIGHSIQPAPWWHEIGIEMDRVRSDQVGSLDGSQSIQISLSLQCHCLIGFKWIWTAHD